jgi:predicted phosphodiesterase
MDFFEETFESREEAFGMYNDKMVFSAMELAYQQRTMWFIRDKKDTDKCNEILLYNAKNVSPSNFDESFTQLKSNELLWLSDLHFSNGTQHAYDKGEFQNILTRNLRMLDKIEPSELILSGDYAYKACHDEFEAAKEAIFSITSQAGIMKTNIAMCPGNHDFGFDLSESGIIPIKTEYATEYSRFYKDIFQCAPNNDFCSIKRVITRNMVPLEIICINTLTMQQVQYDGSDGKSHKFIGMGQVGEEQLEKLHDKLKETEDKNCIRILVMHHNLLPVFYAEKAEFDKPYSGLLDAGRVMNFIFNEKIDIVLHGHVHKQSYKILSNVKDGEKQECHVIGIGSCGVDNAELSENQLRMYAILSFEKRSEAVVKFYKMEPMDQEAEIEKCKIELKEKA